ncbi:hypothetical protein EDB80DRAFT_451285 [Ilyonectria destructans]|nr:hypothetical protein EDB80DRAFT_451285 [Ilyonectria destructans]
MHGEESGNPVPERESLSLFERERERESPVKAYPGRVYSAPAINAESVCPQIHCPHCSLRPGPIAQCPGDFVVCIPSYCTHSIILHTDPGLERPSLVKANPWILSALRSPPIQPIQPRPGAALALGTWQHMAHGPKASFLQGPCPGLEIQSRQPATQLSPGEGRLLYPSIVPCSVALARLLSYSRTGPSNTRCSVDRPPSR